MPELPSIAYVTFVFISINAADARFIYRLLSLHI